MGELKTHHIPAGEKIGLLRMPVSTIFICLGLFTVSWDRFAQIDVGSLNLKAPAICFTLAFALTIFDGLRGKFVGGRQPRIVRLAVLIIGVFFVAGLFAPDQGLAMIQTVVTIVTAIIPFAAVYLNLRLFPERLEQALTAFIRGGLVAAVFGLYQLAAFYTGLPQVVTYTDMGGGFGRISSFSYESGYFGYFMVLTIAALFARAALRGGRLNRAQFVLLFAALILANSRATVFTIPLLLVLLFFRKPDITSARVRAIPIVFLGGLGVLILWLTTPQLFESVFTWFSTVIDPNEQASNRPRLETYDSAWNVVKDHLFLGVGGGNFRDLYIADGGTVNIDWAPNRFIANNSILQALLDGGVVLLVAEGALVVAAFATLYRRALPVSWYLMAGWLAALVVSSIVTSYFFDMKLWVVLALACAASAHTKNASPPVEPAPYVRRLGRLGSVR